MKLDPKIVEEMKSYRRCGMSFIDDRGYPYSIASGFNLKEAENYIEIPKPKSLKQRFAPDQRACIILHHHDDKLDRQRQVLLRGVVDEQDDKLIFTPQHVSAWDSRGIKNMLKFILNGISATNKYFKGRGVKKPHIEWKSYDARQL